MAPTDALTRAHVLAPVPITADPHHEIRETSGAESDNDEEVIETTTPISRKERRKQKKQNHSTGLPTPPCSDTETSKPPKNALKKQLATEQHSSFSLSTAILSMPPAGKAAAKVYPLLICSIGNPGATYAHTLHSAGHTVTSHIASVKSYRPFTKGLSGLVARPDNTTYSFGVFQGFKKETLSGPPEEDDWTFWQSTSLMNISGSGVRRAWNEFSKQVIKEGLEPRLVVIHDELESALGKVSIKDGSASPRGHNGLKSCQSSLRGLKWWRIGVGIGRPESREPDVVSRYVLRKMNGSEAKAIEKASVGVVEALRMISEGKK